MKNTTSTSRSSAFTLVELLTVIAIIAVLMGLLFPAISTAKEAARKTQAKTALTEIVTAVKSYYTEYGKYPVKEGSTGDDTYGTDNDRLFNVLRPLATATGYDLDMNPRKLSFIDVPASKQLAEALAKNGICENGHYHDPWGGFYYIRIDGDYNNQIANPYSANAGFSTIDGGVIAWSLGKNQPKGGTGDKNSADSSDDVISWQ